jgi:hypothetical protein
MPGSGVHTLHDVSAPQDAPFVRALEDGRYQVNEPGVRLLLRRQVNIA